MGKAAKLWQELKAVGLALLYFGSWLAALLLIKHLVLAEYDIQFMDLSKALIGALILSKVVLIMEHVPLGAWLRGRSAWMDVFFRTALYMFGVFVVLVLEKAFEGRHEYGGLGASLAAVFEHTDIHHLWLNLVVIGGALLVYNILAVIERHLGRGGVYRLLLTPLPEQPRSKV